jgi:hypothetical protein
MSSIKRYMEQEQTVQEFVDALESLIENKRLNHNISIGIAKKIIVRRSLDGLSEKQLAVFESYINKELEIPCKGHCDNIIPLGDIPNSLANNFEDNGLYCQHCRYDIRKMHE